MVMILWIITGFNNTPKIGAILSELKSLECSGQIETREDAVKWLKKRVNIKLKIINLRCPVEESMDLYAVLDLNLNLNKDDIVDLLILRRSTDARKADFILLYLVLDVFMMQLDAEKLLEDKNV